MIRHKMMAAMHKLYVGDSRGFGKLNKAHIVLIPKKADATAIGDYRPPPQPLEAIHQGP